MKIKTMTIFNAYNYGTSLQAYALMSYLQWEGHEVEIINYKPEYLTRKYDYKWVNPESGFDKYGITRFIYRILKFIQRQFTLSRKASFDKFNKECLNYTDTKYISFDELKRNPPPADIYIVGSDQVWNSFYHAGKDPAFYLDFVPKGYKRISYAASFAISEIEENLKPVIQNYLSNFDNIAVREYQGLSILKNLSLSGTWVLDPTFLLTENEWKSMMVPFEKKEKYILVYDFERNKMLKDFAIRLGKEKKMKIYSINDTYPLLYANRNYNSAGPKEFLTLIYNCDYFISNSFHGSVFSIIFQKDFFVFDRNRHKVNSRMESLLSMFGLDKQYIHLDSEFNEAVKSKIDYSKVAPILENNLNISRSYFDDILIKSKNKAKMNILNYRGNISCTSCGVCQTICPLNCIHMAQNTEGFYRPIINEKKCNSCGLCKKVCYRNIPQPREFKNFFEDKLIYGAWSKDEHTHSTSTSGGVGHELLKWGIQNGYEACGVIFDSKNDSCKHTIATTLPEIERYKSSKYVQSYTADAFSKFEKDKKYIVVGTPCQIYGLREFIKLNKTENNFILVDFFCHGTPSMLLWKKYKEYIKTNYKLSDFSKVVFRSKDQSSWHRNSLKISDKNNKTYLKDNAFYEDMFFKFFLSDTCLNESCYNCLLRLDNCASDIRLADFWGQKYAHNEKGVSLVTINTEKGNLFFEEVKPLLETDICSVHDLKNSVPTRFLQKNNKLAMKVMKLLQSENNLSMIYKKTIFPLMKLLYSEHKWSMIYNKMVSLLK